MTYSQMFTHGLQPVKGDFEINQLDKVAPLDNAINTATAAGRVGTLNSTGEIILGNGGNGWAMPLYLWHASDALSVSNDAIAAAGYIDPVSVHPNVRGKMMGLVATGGYELQTTEFNDDDNYAPNDLLTADSDGIIELADTGPGTDWLVGVASWHVNQLQRAAAPTGPVGVNAHGISTLTFWSYYQPTTTR